MARYDSLKPFTATKDSSSGDKTCSDCVHFDRCKSLMNYMTGDETECDWTPSKFLSNNYEDRRG